jgi:hypothetical protein
MAIAVASGSSNNRAMNAEASTTLVVAVSMIAVRPNDVYSFARGPEAQLADFRQEFDRRQTGCRPCRFLDDCHQLTLQRPMVPSGPFA